MINGALQRTRQSNALVTAVSDCGRIESLSLRTMPQTVTFPVEYDRKFEMKLYWSSHGSLLLRSGKTDQHPTRMDILFCDVRWMALPVWFEGLRIERGELSDIPIPLTAKINEEAHFMSVFRVISQGVTHCVFAGGVYVAEDQEGYAVDSPLLPYLDFRAFVAPLWKHA
jgi:hypothetical protein